MSIPDLYLMFLESSGISTDTRSIKRDSIFFALKGEHFDGSEFVYEALEKGSMGILAPEAKEKDIKSDTRFQRNVDRIIFVPEPLVTLQVLAHHHRSNFSIPIIAITGTNGKTTTKELVSEVLAEKYRIVKTEGNLNNHIGVPLTLLRIRKGTEIAIIEMGANNINDIKDLCKIAEPTHGLITNIGIAHLEGFGSKEGVAKAKGALYEWLRDHKGTIFINKFDQTLTNLLWDIDPSCNAETIRYGDETIPENKNLFGAFNRENMRAAVAVGSYFKVPKAESMKALKKYEPKNMRSQIIKTAKGNEIILDAYNANPSSMKAALESFALRQTTKPKWIIIGDMKELGDSTNEAHLNVLKDISFYCLNNVILIGEAYCLAHRDLKQYACFKTKEEFINSPFASSIKQAEILIKGSNSMRMWEIADKL
jgi:UDP-N-acetylmuramoyl-tripeptide--D-alanyl-D-alanine ligase